MTDKDFSELKNIKAPPSRAGAKEAALKAALLAFDEAADHVSQKNISPQPQGLSFGARLRSIFTLNPWSWIMENRTLIGTCAAVLIVLPIAGQLMLSSSLTPPFVPEILVKKTDTLVIDEKTEVDQDSSSRMAKVLSEKEETVLGRAAPASPVAIAPPAPELSAPGKNLSQSGLQRAQENSPARVRVRRSLPQAKQKSRLGGVIRQDYPVPRKMLLESAQLNDRERFEKFDVNGVLSVAEKPVSTFSIDVDTASYGFARKSLNGGHLPNKQSVRVEEMINYFSYDYPAADTTAQPFKPTVAIYPTPWNTNTKLLHIGIKGHEIIPVAKPRSNLVFLIDVSGSMNQRDKLPLLKSAFRLLVNQLDDKDTVSIVTYAGNAGTVLEPTKVSEKHKIFAAFDRLRSGGSTAGARGIAQAYALAEQSYDKKGVNRVILATDGDFNVGMSSPDKLKSFIEEKRKSGVFLSVLGFGRGNYNDALMQTLAQNGNGTAAYIDTLKEAHKVLVKEAGSTLFPIAKDVKIQIEFNPKLVSEYRLIGYETRALKRADFNNDKVDAGDIGSGHTVTAIYEFTPADSSQKMIDDLRYKKPATRAVVDNGDFTGEYAFLKMRYKLPKEEISKLITVPITTAMEKTSISGVSKDMQFAASVAAFGQKLRGNSQLADYGYDKIVDLATAARGTDAYGYRAEFISLVRLAKGLGVKAKVVPQQK